MGDARALDKAVAAALLAGVTAVAAAPASGQTLEEAVRMTLETNPRIEAAANNRDAISHELRQARAFYLPQLDVEARVGYGAFNDLSSRRGGDTYLQTFPREARAVIQQRVFDGFETDSRVAREKARMASASLRVYERAEFISLDVTNAYLEVLRQRELLALAEENADVHREILGSMEERLTRGVGTRADVVQTATRLGRADATVSERQKTLREAESRFNALVGEYPAGLTMPTFPEEALPTGQDATLELVVEANPTIQVREADIDAAEAQVRIAEANFYPKLNIEADTVYRDAFDGTDTHQHDNRIMLVLRWNLYSGGGDVANRREALARVSEAKSERTQTLRDAREEVENSWAAVVSETRRVSDLSEAVENASATRNAYLEEFRVAQRTLLDVLDAENEMFAVRSQLVTAENNLVFAKYRVLALIGNLVHTLGLEQPEATNPTPASFSEDVFGVE